MALHRALHFQPKKKKILDCWPLPDDYSEAFVSFFKEFGWKVDDCLNLSINQILTITDAYIKQNTPKKPKVNTKDKNITIIETEDEKNRTLDENRRIKRLVEDAEKRKGSKLTAIEMNKLLKKI